ncbi:MAG TPA: monovalent cation/H+ antiporter subunit D family protein [Bacteroidota bacterium]|nr:monovalent cation/H+ antiporter subunit D family protein [Bacteroidota bacterium]
MSAQHIPILIPLILLLGAMLTSGVGLWRKSLVYPVVIASLVCALTLAAAGLYHAIVNETIRYAIGGWLPPVGIEYVLDPLSGFMLVVILFVAAVVLVHARVAVESEIPGRRGLFYAVALLLLTGFSGIVLTGDLFNLYVFLEISSLASYALIAVGEKPAPVAAFRYLLVGTMGASLYLLGIGFLYVMTGSLNIADLASILPTIGSHPTIIIALALVIVGLAIKMALFPLHGWQPDAYTYAPSAVTALLAPIGAKVGAYVLIRMLFYVFEPSFVSRSLPVAEIIGWLSMVGILFGSILAMAQKELKRMLAYSSIAQIGYIGLGIGLANPMGFVGAILHVLNHAFMKCGLFLVAGNLRLCVGHSTIPAFDDRLRRTMPWTMAAFTVFALSMIGIPPLAGFFSKWYLVLGALDRGSWVGVAVILLSSLLNAVYFFRVLEKVYLRSPNAAEAPVNESHLLTSTEDVPSTIVPTVLLAVSVLVLGLLNALIVSNVIVLMLPEGL